MTSCIHAQVGGRQGGAKFLAVRGGRNFFRQSGGRRRIFWSKRGVKRTLLRGELKIVQQRGAKLPPGRTLNRGVQMKKNFVRGGQKNFSYGVLSSCACMIAITRNIALMKHLHWTNINVLLGLFHTKLLLSNFPYVYRSHQLVYCTIVLLVKHRGQHILMNIWWNKQFNGKN